jgi:hypothetical protein
MGRATLFVSLSALQFQNLAQLTNIPLPWPSQWLSAINVFRFINFDPRDIIVATGLPPITFHTLYIFVANVIPLIITVLCLVLFQPVTFVIWYACFVGSLVMLAAGAIMHFADGLTLGLWLLVGGGFLFVGSTIVGLVTHFTKEDSMHKTTSRSNFEGGALAGLDDDDDDEEEAETALAYHQKQQQHREKMLRFGAKRSMKLCAITVVLFLVGCLLTGVFFTSLAMSSAERGTLSVIGYACFVLALIAGIYFVGSLSDAGRARILKVEKFLSANTLLVLLMLINITYMPTVDFCINSYMCATYSCPAGYRFNPYSQRKAGSFATDEALFCDKCTFLDDRCRSPGGTAFPPNTTAVGTPPAGVDPLLLCPAFSDSRVWKHPEVSCGDASLTYFFVSSALVLVAYIVIIPLLYGRLIKSVAKRLLSEGELIPEDCEENLEYVAPPAKYDRLVLAIEPAAASLYQPFTIHQKYFMIYLLFFRLVMVLITSVVAAFTTPGALVLLGAVHVCAVVALIHFGPFASRLERNFAYALEGCSLLAIAYAMLLQFGVPVPWWVGIIVLVLNIVVPLVVAVMTLRFVQKRSGETGDAVASVDRTRKLAEEAVADGRGHLYVALPPPDAKKAAAPAKSAVPHAAPAAAMRAPTAIAPLGTHELHRDPNRLANPFLDAAPMTLLGGVPQLQSTDTLVRQVRKHGLSVHRAPPPRKLCGHEIVAIDRKNDELTWLINMMTKDKVTKFFAVIGVLLLLALGCSITGFNNEPESKYLWGSSQLHRSPAAVLAGYPSFPALTGECCCMASRTGGYNVTERWVCPGKGTVLTRAREGADGRDSGIPLRPLCGQQGDYRFGCATVVRDNTSANAVVAVACSDTLLTKQLQKDLHVTTLAKAILF